IRRPHVATAARLAGFPPVGIVAFLAQKREHADAALPACSALAAELPELARGALVAVDQVIELEGVDLPCVQPREAIAHPLEQRKQLLPVVRADRLSRLPPSGSFFSTATLLGTHLPNRTPAAFPAWLRSSSPQSWVGAADLTAPFSRRLRRSQA